ncbi:MAG: DinB family protein [Chitinophagales bacterium]
MSQSSINLASFLTEMGYESIQLAVNKTSHFEISGHINGIEARFILDTGASDTVIDLSRAEQFQFTELKSLQEKASGVGSTSMDISSTTNVVLGLENYTLKLPLLHLTDLSHVNNALQMHQATPIDGIIGAGVLQQHKAVISYEDAQVFLKRPEMKVLPETIPAFYRPYFHAVEHAEPLEALQWGKQDTIDFFSNIGLDKADYQYAPDKWTIKQILQHLIDAERVFSYRALRFARNDSTDLSGFEQDDYVQIADVSNRSLSHLVQEYTTVRNSTLSLFESFDETSYERIGTASGNAFSVVTLAYLIAGHEIHHKKIIKERYL